MLSMPGVGNLRGNFRGRVRGRFRGLFLCALCAHSRVRGIVLYLAGECSSYCSSCSSSEHVMAAAACPDGAPSLAAKSTSCYAKLSTATTEGFAQEGPRWSAGAPPGCLSSLVLDGGSGVPLGEGSPEDRSSSSPPSSVQLRSMPVDWPAAAGVLVVTTISSRITSPSA